MFSYVRFDHLKDKIIEFEHNDVLNIVNCYVHFRESTSTDDTTLFHTIGSRHVAQIKKSETQFFNKNCDEQTIRAVMALIRVTTIDFSHYC